MRVDNGSGYPGVSFKSETGKWVAYIVRGGKQQHLGTFAKLEDAVKARKAAEKKAPSSRKPYDAKTQAWIDAAPDTKERKRRQQRAKYLRNGAKYRARMKKQYNKNPDKVLKRNAKWREENPEKNAAAKAAWERQDREKNPEKYREKWKNQDKVKMSERGKKWREENPDKNCAKSAKYRAAKLQRTVPWANEFFIQEAYALAKLRTELTGIEWDVDHIIPLQGENISGLHVETNLQVIPASENRAKANQWTDECA